MLVIAADLKESLQRCKIINDGQENFMFGKFHTFREFVFVLKISIL